MEREIRGDPEIPPQTHSALTLGTLTGTRTSLGKTRYTQREVIYRGRSCLPFRGEQSTDPPGN